MIPPPSYVAQVWLNSETLCVHFPQANEGKGHTIYLSNDVYGLTCMVQILQERQKEGPYTVGHKSTPTQWQIDRDIARLRGDQNVPKVNVAKLSREDRETLRFQREVERRKARKERDREEKLASGQEMLKELGLI